MCTPHRVVRTGLVFCEPCHRRVEASFVGLCWRWRRTFWTLLMIATLKITMSKWRHCKLIIGDDFLFSFAVNVNEQRIIAFLTEKCCYLNFRFYRNRLRGFRAVKGQNGGLSLTFIVAPYKRSALPCCLWYTEVLIFMIFGRTLINGFLNLFGDSDLL